MPRIPVHTLNSVPEGSREHAEHFARRMGMFMNIHAEMSHSPVVIATYQGMQRAIAEHGTFDARTREAIALAVGNQNGCDYCQAAHTVSARRAGFADDQIRALRAGEVGFNDRLETLTEVARAVAANTGYVPEQVWQAALESGWTDTELTEAFAHIAVNMFTNYFNHYAHTDLDIPAAEPLTA